MRLAINVSGVHEEKGEDVLDPKFNKEVQGQPIHEIVWDKKEDKNI